MDIFDIFAAASFEYAVYSNLAATDLPEHGEVIVGWLVAYNRLG